MPRDDLVWARVDCSILHDPRFTRLRATDFRFYMTAYLFAFEQRADVLPAHYDMQSISIFARLDQRTAAKALQKCCDVGLLKLTADRRIHVVAARKTGDSRIRWQDAERGEDGGQMGTITPIEREKEEKEGESQKAPPPPVGKVSPANQVEITPTDGSTQGLVERILGVLPLAARKGGTRARIENALKLPGLDLRELEVRVEAVNEYCRNVALMENEPDDPALLLSRYVGKALDRLNPGKAITGKGRHLFPSELAAQKKACEEEIAKLNHKLRYKERGKDPATDKLFDDLKALHARVSEINKQLAGVTT